MNPHSPRSLLAALAICGGLAGCTATTSSSNIVQTGPNIYTVIREAHTTFERDTEKLKTLAQEDAARFCAEKGRQLKVVDVSVNKPLVTAGFISAKVVFKALDPAEAAAEAAPAPAPVVAAPISGDLYTQLTKLDELRQKGILTDEEFQAEKKKILSRSK